MTLGFSSDSKHIAQTELTFMDWNSGGQTRRFGAEGRKVTESCATFRAPMTERFTLADLGKRRSHCFQQTGHMVKPDTLPAARAIRTKFGAQVCILDHER